MEHKKIPSLDGWRAVSILIVIVGHQLKSFTMNGMNPKLLYFDYAHIGVQIFFVISGFLITNLLMKEEKKTNTISFKDFYIRRAFRILPAFFAFLLITFILNGFLHYPLDSFLWIKALFFISNFYWAGGIISHSWSLSVEEQFYLFWPVIFIKKRLNTIIPMFFICIVPVLEILQYTGKLQIGSLNTFLNIDSILIGALYSIYKKSPFLKLLTKFQYPIIFFSLFLQICSRLSVHYTGILTVPFAHSFFAVAVILLIDISMNTNTYLYKSLNTRPLIFIGQISYSLYLWQQVFIFQSPLISDRLIVFPFNMIWIFICAYLSSILIEKPFLKLRTKIFPVTY